MAIDPSNTCRICRYCLEGRYNLCKKTIYFGSAATDPHIDGSFREYIPVLAHRCHLIPAALPFREAALLEPLSVALHGIGQAGNIAGKRVLICGAGPIGQLLGLVARHYGAERLAVSDCAPLPWIWLPRCGPIPPSGPIALHRSKRRGGLLMASMPSSRPRERRRPCKPRLNAAAPEA